MSYAGKIMKRFEVMNLLVLGVITERQAAELLSSSTRQIRG
jgi:hypothetical protein